MWVRMGLTAVIFASMCVALLLSALPLPEAILVYKPLWPVMVLMYWAFASPGQVNYGMAIILGLCMDVQQGVLLGQNMLSLSIVLYLSNRMYKTIRLASVPMKALVAGLIFAVYLFANWLVSVATGAPPAHFHYWLPVMSSSLLWPWVFLLLRDIRRRAIAP